MYHIVAVGVGVILTTDDQIGSGQGKLDEQSGILRKNKTRKKKKSAEKPLHDKEQ